MHEKDNFILCNVLKQSISMFFSESLLTFLSVSDIMKR